MKILDTPVTKQAEETDVVYDVSRRRFFQLAGGMAGAGLLLAACKTTPPSDTYVGSGDIGLLNYLYILEQVQAAFYIQATATPYYGLTTSDNPLLADMRDQAIAHRELLRVLLGKSAIKAIVTNLSAITFADRTSTLSNAAAIGNMCVAGYNGAAQLFTNTDYVLVTSKMASAVARWTAYASDILAYNSFADPSVVDPNGLNEAIAPVQVMAIAETFIQTKFDISKLPTF